MRLRLFCILAMLFASPGSTQTVSRVPHRVREARYLMGTVCEITVYSSGEESYARDAIAAAFNELHRIDGLLSSWKSDSALMRANVAAGAVGNPRPRTELSVELYTRIEIALRLADLTNGLFDPTVGPLVRAWGFLPKRAETPRCSDCASRTRAIAAARGKVGWQKVLLQPATHEMEFTVPGMELDLGGIGKGYAAERAIEVLKQRRISIALVNLGSSSLKSLGMPPLYAGCPAIVGEHCAVWPIEIADPRNRHHIEDRVYLPAGYGMGTSGTYEKSLGKRARYGSHLIDPSTGQSLAGEFGVSVIAPDAEVADALTKPFILRPSSEAEYGPKLVCFYPDLGVLTLSVRKGRLIKKTFGRIHVQNFTAATPMYLSAPP